MEGRIGRKEEKNWQVNTSLSANKYIKKKKSPSSVQQIEKN